MAAFGFSDDYTNILTAGLSTWKIKSGKSGEVGYVDLAPISEGEIIVRSFNATKARRRPVPFAYGIEAKARILGTAKATFLQKLNYLTGYLNLHSLTMINGQAFAGTMGTFWRFVCDGSMDANRYVEIGADLAVLGSHASYADLDALFTSVEETASDPADYLYALDPGTIYPAGFADLDTRNAGETSWETMGAWRNPSLTAELVVTKDDKLRSIGYAVNVSCAFDLMQTDEELDLMDSFSAGSPDFRATLSDGTIFTFADNIGLSWEHHNDRDMEEIAYTRVTGSGSFTPAAFVALIT